ncbi:hypothetical protein CLIB1423_10S00870 [[Candida] railenensis]|uniref:NADH dehydrogenase [ubiquinone] 1 beta subcomplex subunit 7 n=1 Tax=[Candida] railenensis TaxID=45579 RepID=A0A9P0VY37_9ASCO|nr:hypothetical protein CLIB1423_10S00870 [[Candida] railenensis]
MTVTEFPPLLSEEDLQKYKIPLRWRDRCAAYYALYQICLTRQSANSSIECKLDKHAWEECENLDFIRRKKELADLKENLKEN